MTNIPEIKLGIIAVSRDCFPIALSERRRKAIVSAYGEGIYECPVTVENELDMLKAVEDVKKAECNALVVFLGNFGPETPETLIAKNFDGPVMFVAAAEGDGDMINGRGDAYCGMLNCSYNLGMRHLKGFIPEYPVGTADDIVKMIKDFVPVARAVIGVKNLKIITFGPRPQDFFACNAPIKGLYELGVEIEENSELDLLVSFKEHENDPRIDAVCADMAKEMGEGRYYSDLNKRMAQFELTLLDWAENHKGYRKYVAFADKCWPAFPSQFGFEPCYVNSRLVSRGIPVSCEVDIYGALSEYIGMCISADAVTLISTTPFPSTYMTRISRASTTILLQTHSWASTAEILPSARCAQTVLSSTSLSSTVCLSQQAASLTSLEVPLRAISQQATLHSIVYSATARDSSVHTSQRARSSMFLHVPSEVSVFSRSPRWDASTVTFWLKSVIPTTVRLHSVTTESSCSTSSVTSAFRTSDSISLPA